jgi:hypothetical protein
MAGPYDLTGQNIENTYQRVLQTPDGVTFYDGTGSLVTLPTTDTSSLLTTASAVLNILQFTKGDGSTFNITVDTGSGGQTFPYTGNAAITGSLLVTGSQNNIGPFTVNGNTTITGSILMTGSAAISSVNYIDFITGSDPIHNIGRIHWDNDYGTLNVDLNSTSGNEVMAKVGLDNFYYIKNQTGGTLSKGRVIRAAGTLGSSGRLLGDYMIADGSIPYYFTLGIAAEDIADGEDGYVYEFGLLRGINTTGTPYGETWTNGTILWVSTGSLGGFTSVEPTGPDYKIQMAIVINANANGSIFIRPSLRSDVGDLHNVNDSASFSGDLFIKSGSIWKNSKQLTGSYGLTGSLNVVGSITGSLFGTASWAVSASWSPSPTVNQIMAYIAAY